MASESVLPVEAMCYIKRRVLDLIQCPVSVVLHTRGKDHELEVVRHRLQKGVCVGPDIQSLCLIVVVNERLVEVDN